MKLFLPALALLGCFSLSASAVYADDSSMKDIKIKMVTDKGDIDITLFTAKAPVTVANFLNLAKQGFYDDLKFHRVIKDFMVQGGDPQGTGTGGPGYKFEDEVGAGLKFDKPGLLAMANSGPGSNGSQFFITHVPTPWLNGKHTIFGEVTGSQDVVDAIQGGDQIKKIEILDSTDELFEAKAKRISEWNSQLKQ